MLLAQEEKGAQAKDAKKSGEIWQATVFQKFKKVETKSEFNEISRGVPWGIMVGKHGGSEKATLSAYKRGEFQQILNAKYKPEMGGSKGGPKFLYVTPVVEGSCIQWHH